MTNEQMEYLIERIIQRLQPPVLVMVTRATGYQQAIRHRLAGCGHCLHLALSEDIEDAEQWQAMGLTLPTSIWQDALPQTPYRALLLPFLDYPLAADLVNSSLHSPVASRVHDALLRGIPVMALRYHCDPTSELNQLLGAQPNATYAGHMQATLARLAKHGVTLCTMNEMLERLTNGNGAKSVSDGRRYLTVTDVANNPALASVTGAQLTDAAIEYLKNKKVSYLSK